MSSMYRPNNRTRACVSVALALVLTASSVVFPSAAANKRGPISREQAGAPDKADQTPSNSVSSEPSAALKARALEAYSKVGMSFEENRGQTDDEVKFMARGSGYTLFLTPAEAVFVLARKSDAVLSEPPAVAGGAELTQSRSWPDAGPPATADGSDSSQNKHIDMLCRPQWRRCMLLTSNE